jgi:hypothetical protein
LLAFALQSPMSVANHELLVKALQSAIPRISRSKVRRQKSLKAVVRTNQNNAGIYSVVNRVGRLAGGQTMLLCGAAEKIKRG